MNEKLNPRFHIPHTHQKLELQWTETTHSEFAGTPAMTAAVIVTVISLRLTAYTSDVDRRLTYVVSNIV